ncbi:sensor histidine kinase [Hydrogenimonas sp.]
MKRNQIAYKFTLATMMVASLGVGMLAWLSYEQAKELFVQQSVQKVIDLSQNYREKVAKTVGALKYDLTMIRLSQSMQGLLRAFADPYRFDERTNKTFSQYVEETGNLFTLMLQQNLPYFQIRLIDAQTGAEIVRVERQKDGAIVNVPRRRLQIKRHRDYVKEALEIPDGQVYLSHITLNREYHTVEIPYRPTIRAIVSDRVKHDKRVLIVINADVSKLFDFESFRGENGVRTLVANEQGYYLYNPENPLKEFGFEFGREEKMSLDYPKSAPLFEKRIGEVEWYDESNDLYYHIQRIPLDAIRSIAVLKAGGSELFAKKASEYQRTLLEYVVLTVFFLTLFAAWMVWRLTRPITRLSEIARKIARTKGRSRVKIDVHTHDEIEELARSLQTMLDALLESRREIERFAQKLEHEVERKTEALRKLNEELEKKVQEGIEEIRKKDETMLQQAKLAEMGEMIGAIAHQWRQPLNALALNIQSLEDMAALGELDEAEIEQFIAENMKTIRFMSKTIDNFRNFYRTEKESQPFDLKKAVEETITLQQAQLEARDIELHTELEPVEVVGYKNDFMQVLLNLISNARDAILHRREREKRLHGRITVRLFADGDEAVVRVEDNGGGIAEEILSRIFEPYFTTKEEGNGTGLGLHMAKRIIEEKMGGRLLAFNGEEGAVFEIRLKVKR